MSPQELHLAGRQQRTGALEPVMTRQPDVMGEQAGALRAGREPAASAASAESVDAVVPVAIETVPLSAGTVPVSGRAAHLPKASV